MTRSSEPDMQRQVNWFRQATPYIQAHRGRLMVLTLSGEALSSPQLDTLIQDITLLHSLGVKLVLAFGCRPQLNAALQQQGLDDDVDGARRVTDSATLAVLKQVVGELQARLMGGLSMGSALAGRGRVPARVVVGNLVIARPVGVVNGTDYQHTGDVRRIDVEGVASLLASDHIVLLPPLGYSSTGECFNISVMELAAAAAIALKADKLISFVDGPGLVDAAGDTLAELNPRALDQLLPTLAAKLQPQVAAVGEAVKRGVKRAHVLSFQQNGALIEELFSRDGVGTLVTNETYEQVRAAHIGDVAGILALIEPLESSGVLVRRGRERLEAEIEQFTVDERDGAIIGCAALYPFPDQGMAELACVAVDPAYRTEGRGDALLKVLEKQARAMSLTQLFVLTTQTAHWFVERGFVAAGVEALPVSRQKLYNMQRNSKVFVKVL